MTRKEDRSEQSKRRAEEHRRRSRMRVALFTTAVTFYFVVPVLWYGAIEFGLIHPIRTLEFKNAVNYAGAVPLLVMLYFLPEVWRRRKDPEQFEESATSTPTSN